MFGPLSILWDALTSAATTIGGSLFAEMIATMSRWVLDGALTVTDWVWRSTLTTTDPNVAAGPLAASYSNSAQVAIFISVGFLFAGVIGAVLRGQPGLVLQRAFVDAPKFVIIALIGIANTLALSVFERTRELGLLRAVGMSASQVRRMIRWEATMIALFGAVLGVIMGLTFGWGTVTALPDSFVSVTSVPTARVGLLVLASAIAGLIAALLPARRAARMNLLDAITGR